MGLPLCGVEGLQVKSYGIALGSVQRQSSDAQIGCEFTANRNDANASQLRDIQFPLDAIPGKCLERYFYAVPARRCPKRSAIGLPGQPDIIGTQVEVVNLIVAVNIKQQSLVTRGVGSLSLADIQCCLNESAVVIQPDGATQSQTGSALNAVRREAAFGDTAHYAVSDKTPVAAEIRPKIIVHAVIDK